MLELPSGLWHWQAPHPEWTPTDRWPQWVSSSAIDDGTHLLLFDPLAVPAEILQRAGDRVPAIVLTAPWHERDTRILAKQLGATVYAPEPDTNESLMAKFGVTAEEAAGGSPDLTWLLDADDDSVQWFGAGDRLPFGVEVFPGREDNDLVLWNERFSALIPGDTLVDFGKGFQINEWLRGGITREAVVERLRTLLDLPVEFVLPAHGEATDRPGLVRALA